MTQQPAPQTPKGLAISALAVGIAAFLVGLVPVLGTLAGIAALILGVVALNKKQPKGFALTGLILGAVAMLSSISITLGLASQLDTIEKQEPKPAVVEPTVPAKPKPEPTPTEEPAEEPTPVVLDEITAAQFLAQSWENRFPYGGDVHWILDRITTDNGDGTYTFKIGATLKNEYGTKMKATVEGDVGGTTDNPVILDSILYTSTGEIISYNG